MRIERVTRYVPTQSFSANGSSGSAFVGVSLPRVTILERPDPDARPKWQGRPASESIEAARSPRILSTRCTAVRKARAQFDVMPAFDPVDPFPTEMKFPTPAKDPVWNRTAVPLEPEDQDGLTSNQMLRLLSQSLGSALGEIQSPSRAQFIVRIRMAIIWAMLRHYPSVSLNELGRRLNRDHTTMINARNKVMRCLTACGLSTAPQATPYDTACLALRALGGGE